MTVQALYDFSPLVRMLCVGLLLALGPLTWIWYQQRRATPLRRIRALTLLTLFLTFDLLLFGAFTRLTDSGLGCPDWPGCYGQASPLAAHGAIAAAQSAMPSGPVTHDKAWIEMIHRYLATSVGVLMVVLAVAAWLGRRRQSVQAGASVWWPTLTLLWVCLQGAFGALTVTMKLFPAIVTLHLLGGMVLLALLCVQVVRLAQLDGAAPPVALASPLRRLLWLSFALLALQVALGGWVSTNYAVLACTDFPMCQGSWWPLMDFRQGFELWRELGLTHSGATIGFAALTAIHYAHRLLALLVLASLGLLAWRLGSVPALRRPARWLAGLTALQLATGLSNVLFDWPLLVAVLHTGGAAALVLVMSWTLAASRRA
ncbi:MAG: COX15/CtaA family protein [Rhodoferax sp.]|uniref:COX15/CtaA family protein n=1 Tax=Rhodoferax sp. TaxID=50421 RepID=UPI002615DF1C|nr:COX15/CtaA family protein [Rhodoferax sp.]MDD5333852.1 COX15/CtaA family protein [Rhodoferax sp.]